MQELNRKPIGMGPGCRVCAYTKVCLFSRLIPHANLRAQAHPRRSLKWTNADFRHRSKSLTNLPDNRLLIERTSARNKYLARLIHMFPVAHNIFTFNSPDTVYGS